MKLINTLLLIFLILLCFNNIVQCQDDDEDNSLDGDQNSQDSFDALGIPAFKLDIAEKKKPKQKLKLNSIEDLPRFIESGQYSNNAGIKLITKFLSEDDQELKEVGGLYDETGMDGLDKEEDEEAFGTPQRDQQRARSAALLYMKANGGSKDFQPYGETADKEVVENWQTWQVLMMNTKGAHDLVKVCIPDQKNIDNVIVFGMGDKETCAEKVQIAYDLTEKGKKYYKKAGFEKFLPKSVLEDKTPQPYLGDPALKQDSPTEKKDEKQDDNKKEENDKNDNKQDDKKDDTLSSESIDTSDMSEEDKEMMELQKKMKEVADKKKKKKEEEEKKKKEEEELKKLEQKNSKKNDDKKESSDKKSDSKDDENSMLKDEVQLLKEQLAELKSAIKPQSSSSSSDTKDLKEMYAKKDRESHGIYSQIQSKIYGKRR